METLRERPVGVPIAGRRAPEVHVGGAEAEDGAARGARGGAGEALLQDEAGELVRIVVVGAARVGGGAHLGGGEGADHLAAPGAVRGRVQEERGVELGGELLDQGGVHGPAQRAGGAGGDLGGGVGAVEAAHDGGEVGGEHHRAGGDPLRVPEDEHPAALPVLDEDRLEGAEPGADRGGHERADPSAPGGVGG